MTAKTKEAKAGIAPVLSRQQEISLLTLDRGARKAGEYLDSAFTSLAQMQTALDDCCGDAGLRAERGGRTVHDEVSALTAQVAGLTNEFASLRAEFAELRKGSAERGDQPTDAKTPAAKAKGSK